MDGMGCFSGRKSSKQELNTVTDALIFPSIILHGPQCRTIKECNIKQSKNST